MRRHVLHLVAIVLLTAGLGMAPAHAAPPDAAFCDYTAVNGSISWSPGLVATSTSQSISMTVNATCQGSGDEAGAWTFSLSGTTTEQCLGGSGSGSVTATGANESYSSTFSYTHEGPFISVNVAPAGPPGDAASLFLHLPFAAWTTCPIASASLQGTGGVADTAPGPGPTSAHLTGSGVVSPGLTLTVSPQVWTLSGTATGLFNNSAGSCSFAASWTVAADTAAASLTPGNGSAGCSSTGISISCPTIAVTRAAGILSMTGTCTGGALNGNFAIAFTSVFPWTTYTADGGFSIV
ncbi:MAG TPA: hypothetical protein VGO92_12345 [Acidimicrobiales bacterium]|nr:hypothetical protein [Acidimicrobiales bacterium]